MYTCIPSFLDFLPILVTTEHWVEFPVLYSRFSLVIYFIHSNVYMSIPISQFIPPPVSPLGVHTYRDCHTEWSKSEREKQISYINACMWNLEKWYRWTYLQSRNRGLPSFGKVLYELLLTPCVAGFWCQILQGLPQQRAAFPVAHLSQSNPNPRTDCGEGIKAGAFCPLGYNF